MHDSARSLFDNYLIHIYFGLTVTVNDAYHRRSGCGKGLKGVQLFNVLERAADMWVVLTLLVMDGFCGEDWAKAKPPQKPGLEMYTSYSYPAAIPVYLTTFLYISSYQLRLQLSSNSRLVSGASSHHCTIVKAVKGPSRFVSASLNRTLENTCC